MYILLISANPLYKVFRKNLRYSKYDFMLRYFLSLWSWAQNLKLLQGIEPADPLARKDSLNIAKARRSAISLTLLQTGS